MHKHATAGPDALQHAACLAKHNGSNVALQAYHLLQVLQEELGSILVHFLESFDMLGVFKVGTRTGKAMVDVSVVLRNKCA